MTCSNRRSGATKRCPLSPLHLVSELKVKKRNHFKTKLILATLISQSPLLVNGPVNGLNFPSDIIINKSTVPQEVTALRVSGDLRVAGHLSIRETINEMECHKMGDFLSDEPSQFGLYVIGNQYHLRLNDPVINRNPFRFCGIRFGANYQPSERIQLDRFNCIHMVSKREHNNNRKHGA